MISKRNILIIDAILVFGILTLIFLLVGYSQPLVVAPLSSDSHADLLFYLPKTDFVLIDDTTKFDSADTVFIGENVKLGNGRHFIKFFDGLKSEIRQIDSEADIVLEFRLMGNKVGVFNVGDIALNVETYDKGSLINSSVVYTGSSGNGGNG